MNNLSQKTKKELVELCKSNSINGYSGKKKEDIIKLLLKVNVSDINISDDHKVNSHDTNTSIHIDLYDNYSYNECLQKSKDYENSKDNKYYEKNLCLCEVHNTKPRIDTIKIAYDKIKHMVKNSLDEILDKTYNKLCVLPKGHEGSCDHNPIRDLLKKNKITDKIKSKIETAIYSVPGNDGYIYKNRAPRSFPIIIDSETQRKMCQKEQKLSCAIPLSEYATPKMLAASYLDYLILILNIRGIKEYIKEDKIYDLYKNLIISHTKFMKESFESKNRKIFNNEGFLICPILRNEFKIEDLVQYQRDSRIDIYDNDIQLGHIIARSDKEWTIRGMNISMMSRRGNQIIGRYSLYDSNWIEELQQILTNY